MDNIKNKLIGSSKKIGYIALITFVLMSIVSLIMGNNPIQIIYTMFTFPIEDSRKIGNTLGYMSWMVPVALSFAVAYKTGLFNIGMSGQMLFAGIFGVRMAVSGVNVWLIVLAMIILGSLVGTLSGVLKVYFKIHEVVSTIMLNWGIFFFYRWQYKIGNSWVDSENGNSLPIKSSLESSFLNSIFKNNSLLSSGIFLAVIAAIAIFVLLKYTTFGMKMLATGKSYDAARNAGVNVRYYRIMSMSIAGALSGLAAAIFYLGFTRNLSIISQPPLEGFDGITISLIASNGPLSILFSAFIMAMITYSPGGFTGAGIDRNFVIVLGAFMIIAVAVYPFVMEKLAEFKVKRKLSKNKKPKVVKKGVK